MTDKTRNSTGRVTSRSAEDRRPDYTKIGVPFTKKNARRLLGDNAEYLDGRGTSFRKAEQAGIRLIDAENTAKLLPASKQGGAKPIGAIVFPCGRDYAYFKVFYDPAHAPGPKFVNLADESMRIYTPPIGRYSEKEPIHIIEKPAAALAAAAHGIANVYGVAGCHGWHDQGETKLKPALADKVEGRDTTFWPDADCATNPNVASASIGALDAIKAAGGRAFLGAVPDLGDGHTGVDDLISEHGVKAFHTAARHSIDSLEVQQLRASLAPFNQIGAAVRFELRHRDDYRFDPAVGEWYAYDGMRWVPGLSAPFNAMRRVIEGMADEAKRVKDDGLKGRIKAAASLQTNAAITAALNIASNSPTLSVDSERFDQHLDLLGVKNGTLDLNTGKLIPATREQLITKFINSVYDPKASAPLWMQFIAFISDGDPAMARFLQEVAGSCLLGYTGRREIIFLFGDGRNGKSIFIEVLLALMGAYGKATRAEVLMKMRDASNAERATPFLEALVGMRFVVASETSDGHAFDDATIKDLTGGDRLAARANYKGPREFTPAFRTLIRGNNKPNLRATDKGARDRLLVCPFTRTVTDAEDDRFLKEKLIASELPGILNWALAGLRSWRANNYAYHVPPAVRALTDECLAEADTVGQWIADNLEVDLSKRDREFRTPQAELTANYMAWCKATNHQPKSGRKLWQDLGRIGIAFAKSNGEKIVYGVSINSGLHTRESIRRRIGDDPAVADLERQAKELLDRAERMKVDGRGTEGTESSRKTSHAYKAH